MHTKGPWTLFIGKHAGVVEILDNDGLPIVGWPGFDDSRRTDEEHKANARLIAAAPELLEALDRIAGYTNAWPDGLSAGDAYEMQAIARQAFRKAKGD